MTINETATLIEFEIARDHSGIIITEGFETIGHIEWTDYLITDVDDQRRTFNGPTAMVDFLAWVADLGYGVTDYSKGMLAGYVGRAQQEARR